MAGMLQSLKTLGSPSALRCFQLSLLNTSEHKATNVWLLTNSLIRKQTLHTVSRQCSALANQTSKSIPFRNTDFLATTRSSCFHQQYMLCSSSSKGFLEKMYPSKEPPKPSPIVSKPEGEEKKKKKRPKWWPESWSSWEGGMLALGLGTLWTSFCLIIIWGPPPRDDMGNIIEDKYTWLSFLGYPLRALEEGKVFTKAIVEPSSRKLLPEPLKAPYYQPPYTLVLEYDDILINTNYKMNKGWVHQKRPGLDQFLQDIGPPLCEVVIYTHKTGMTAFPITVSLDPQGYVSYRLFRDATHYDTSDGSHIKDLDCLNRDLSKVIIIETEHKRVKKHPNNALLLKKWKGDNSDNTLPVLAAFIRAIVASEVDDVRPVLEYYGQFDNPLEAFKERQIQLREQQQAAAAAAKKQPAKSLAGGFGLGLTGRRT